ncbi:MAG: putative transcriptional regulator [Thermococcus sibiricus]|uniref:Putative transcriptional regulator n=1 Tax=Thermococcus sibiricus TaxID=172049 RepID=A0A101ELZ7_9EURY|nr:MAG: putative transcriptional regulator [Thermococcus sibiricus]KUK28202.1 MAG: putative transcriptional regulator [Thermococcus sp. 40_45]
MDFQKSRKRRRKTELFGDSKKKSLEKFKKEIRTGIYAYLILSFLSRERSHGYAIKKALEEVSDGKFVPSESTLYGILKTLEKHELIKGEWMETGGRPRKCYTITLNGEEVLKELKKEINLVKELLENHS